MKAIWKIIIIIIIVIAPLFVYSRLKSKPVSPDRETASVNISENKKNEISGNTNKIEELPSKDMNTSNKNIEDDSEQADIPDLGAFEGLEDELEEMNLSL